MAVEEIKTSVNLQEYFSKMTPEDAATITTMCMDQLCKKAQELKDLYTQLAKTYPFEMGACDLTCIVQVSAKGLPIAPIRGLLGTTDGIKHALAVMMQSGLRDLATMMKSDKEAQPKDDKEQG